MPRRRVRGKDENRRQKILLGAITIFIMVTSTIGFIFGGNAFGGSGGQTVRFRDYSFRYREGGLDRGWEVKVDKQRYLTYFLPQDLLDIDYDPAISEVMDSPLLFVSIAPPNATRDAVDESIGMVMYRLQQDFSRRDVYVTRALSRPPGNDSLPGLEGWDIWGCGNATETVPVVSIRRGENSSITLEDNCVVIAADDPTEFLRLYDRLLLGWLGVMP